MKVILNPSVNVYYSSFYIKGLIDLYGKEAIFFSTKPFIEIEDVDFNFSFTLIGENTQSIKISIQYNDSNIINERCYDWCDVYGCVNVNWAKTPDHLKAKLVSLAPSFGIRVWDKYETFYYAISNYFMSKRKTSFKKFLGKYKRQYTLRLALDEYVPSQVKDNFFFQVSTLWQSDEWVKNDDFVNRIRKMLFNICKSKEELDFEGGFYYNGNHPLNSKYKSLIFNKFLPIDVYIQKTKESTFAFNTPAWLNCNGWKLGEYLAMGKAIISTPLYNDLPEPLIHGENIHFVKDDKYSISKAIDLICSNKLYREKLSQGAIEYYKRNATPLKSLESLGVK